MRKRRGRDHADEYPEVGDGFHGGGDVGAVVVVDERAEDGGGEGDAPTGWGVVAAGDGHPVDVEEPSSEFCHAFVEEGRGKVGGGVPVAAVEDVQVVVVDEVDGVEEVGGEGDLGTVGAECDGRGAAGAAAGAVGADGVVDGVELGSLSEVGDPRGGGRVVGLVGPRDAEKGELPRATGAEDVARRVGVDFGLGEGVVGLEEVELAVGVADDAAEGPDFVVRHGGFGLDAFDEEVGEGGHSLALDVAGGSGHRDGDGVRVEVVHLAEEVEAADEVEAVPAGLVVAAVDEDVVGGQGDDALDGGLEGLDDAAEEVKGDLGAAVADDDGFGDDELLDDPRAGPEAQLDELEEGGPGLLSVAVGEVVRSVHVGEHLRGEACGEVEVQVADELCCQVGEGALAGKGDDAFGRRVDLGHQRDLVLLFGSARLVNTDGVDPDKACVADGDQEGEDAIHIGTDAQLHSVDQEGVGSLLRRRVPCPRYGFVGQGGVERHVDQSPLYVSEAAMESQQSNLPLCVGEGKVPVSTELGVLWWS